ncbi:MAG: hypothetical protein IKR73_09780 [Oscillospiraceae bacterium]|nr:hypothetical protein [Oscillospiraceae bacterium]
MPNKNNEAPKTEEIVKAEATAAKTEATKAEEKPAAKKTAAKKPAAPKKAAAKDTKKAPAKAETKTAERKAPAKKEAAPKAEAKATGDGIEIQFLGDKNYPPQQIIDLCKEAFKKISKKRITSFNVYVNVEQRKAYYTVNGKGQDDFFVEL